LGNLKNAKGKEQTIKTTVISNLNRSKEKTAKERESKRAAVSLKLLVYFESTLGGRYDKKVLGG